MDRTDRVNFRTPHDWHAVEWDDAQKLIEQLRKQEKAGVAEQIEAARAARRPFVPNDDEREIIAHSMRAWIVEGSLPLPRGEMMQFWRDLLAEFPEV